MDYANYFKAPPGVGYRNKQNKPYKNAAAHTPKSQKGLGDYYGTGIVAKLGKVRENWVNQYTYAPDLKKPPKSLA
jgi:hypothetical protein